MNYKKERGWPLSTILIVLGIVHGIIVLSSPIYFYMVPFSWSNIPTIAVATRSLTSITALIGVILSWRWSFSGLLLIVFSEVAADVVASLCRTALGLSWFSASQLFFWIPVLLIILMTQSRVGDFRNKG